MASPPLHDVCLPLAAGYTSGVLPPWHDLRVRHTANLATDREGMSKALFLGKCKTTNSITGSRLPRFTILPKRRNYWPRWLATTYAAKKYTRGVLRGAFGNTAMRLASFVVSGRRRRLWRFSRHRSALPAAGGRVQ